MSKYINFSPFYESKPTAKQISFIHKMEDYGCEKFEGKSFTDASNYIDNNMEYFKEQQQFLK